MSNRNIKQWLSDPNRKFEEGLQLYNAHKTDQKKDQFYKSKPTFPKGSLQYNMLMGDLLRISRILDQHGDLSKDAPASSPKPLISIKPPQKKPITKKIELKSIPKATVNRAQKLKISDDILPGMNYNDLPGEMKNKYDKIKSLSKELGGLKLSLSVVADNEDRKKIADDLCNKFDERHNLWVELDAWYAKFQNDKPDVDIAEIKREIKKRKDYINRNLKELKEDKTLNAKKKEKREANIKRWENEIELLEKKIK